MANWFRVAVVVPANKVEDISVHLFELGCAGIQEDRVDQGVCLIAFFEDQNTQTEILAAYRILVADFGLQSEVQVAAVPDEDWTTSWRDYFRPVYATPRIVICPAWAPEPVPDNGFVILIDPKMAFGTGHHETTRLALRGIEQCILGGEHVFDVGTGSGILSIAAMKLGAKSVVAVDTDSLAIENTMENLALNGIVGGVVVNEGSVGDVDDVFDVVVANIISSILLPLLPNIAAHTQRGGRVILGGILARERASFVLAVEAAGFVIDEMLEDGEWICAVGHRQGR